MTVEKATAIVREYFREQCVASGFGAYFTFGVNGAVENAQGYLTLLNRSQDFSEVGGAG